MRPKNIIGWESDSQNHFVTETKKQFKSHKDLIADIVRTQRMRNPYYQLKERRIYDIYGISQIAQATERNLIGPSKVPRNDIK